MTIEDYLAIEVYPALWNRTVARTDALRNWQRVARWTYG